MKRFEVSWRYALNMRDEHGDRIEDPRRSGGEYRYDAETKDEALEQFMTRFRSKDYVQPFEPELLQVHVYELLSHDKRSAIVAALQALTETELDELLAGVRGGAS